MNSSMELLAGSLAWTLLHFCWQAAAIALVYWVVDRFLDLGLPRARSQASYLVSLAAILAMFAASLATLGYEIAHNHTANQAGNRADGAVVSGFAHLPVFASLPVAASHLSTGAPQAIVSQRAGLDLSAVLPWLDAAWLLGVLCLSARTIGGWWLIQRLRRRGLAEAPAAVLASFSRVRERLDVRWRVDLRISAHIPGPMAIGVLRSLILVPASALLSLSPEQMEAVLAHELAHVRRADYFWNLIQTMIETLFFFHPAVWWVGRRLREQREQCCDDVAVDSCPDALLYATALLSMEEQRNRKLDLAMALDGHQPWSRLRLRIARVLGEESPQPGRHGFMPLPVAALCAGVVILLLPTAHVFGGPPPIQAQTRAQLQAETPAQSVPPAPAPQPTPETEAAPAAAPKITPPALEIAPPAPVPPIAPHAVPEPAPIPPAPAEVEGIRPLLALPRLSLTNPQLAKLKAELSREQTIPTIPTIDGIHGPGLAGSLQRLAQLNASQVAMHAQELAESRQSMEAAMSVQAGLAQAMSELAIARGIASSAAQDALPAAGSDYIDQMRAAGYDLRAEECMSLKILGVTPEYAREMQKLGLGKPSPGDLISMKVQGITPEYVEKLRAGGFELHSFHEAINYKIFNLSPEYVAQMKAAGFASLSPQELLQLRVQGITPEYVAAMKKQFPNATAEELIQLHIFKIDDAFIAEAKRHNFGPLTVQMLVRLRISGVMDNGVNDPEHEK